jgi:hypothetical protein
MGKKKKWYQKLWSWIRHPRKMLKRYLEFRSYRVPRPLNEKDIKWIFAVKDRRINQHYKKYYSPHESAFDEEGNVKEHILLNILSDIIDKMENGWKKVIINNRCFNSIYYMERGNTFELQEAYNKMLVRGIKSTFMSITVKWLNKRKNAPKNWKDIVYEERLMWEEEDLKYYKGDTRG